MFKLLCFAAFIVVAQAGIAEIAPIAYSAAPLAVGAQHQSVLRSLDGNSAVSHYSKAVDTAFSSVRKYDTRVTNDAKLLQPAGIAYAAPSLSYAAPALSYAAPAYSYAPAAPIVKAAPILKAAPALSYAAPAYAPALFKAAPALSYAAPAYGYAAAPIVKAAPLIKAAPAYGYHTYAPSASYVAHVTFDGLGAHYAF